MRISISIFQNLLRAKIGFLLFFWIEVLADGATFDKRIVIQPIQICSADGAIRANPNLSLYAAETRKIWTQAGIHVEFLPWRFYSNSFYLSIQGNLDWVISLTDEPGNGKNTNINVLNMWFVQSISGAYGYSLQGGNGMTISDLVFAQNRLDTIAHEIGHNLTLDHATFGAGATTNLMTGSGRSIPGSTNDIYPDGLQVDFLNAQQITAVRASPYVLALGPPIIEVQPISQSTTVGSNIVFSVQASGAPPLCYQWRYNTNAIIASATNAALGINIVQSTNAGSYHVIVTNSGGSVTSQVAFLSVIAGVAPPVITQQPQNTNVLLGGGAQFHVVATGTPPLYYQWFFNDTNLAGATNSTLVLTNLQDSHAGTYSVVVSNGSVTISSNALLTINHLPVVGTDYLIRSLSNGVKVHISDLLTNDSDPDGDIISFISVSGASTNGGVVTTNQGWIFYDPAILFVTNRDAFSYSISDGRGGTGIGWVTVEPSGDITPSSNLSVTKLSETTLMLQFNGIPGYTYRIQTATNLISPVWQTVGSGMADQSGLFYFTNNVAGGGTNVFFRSVFP